MFHVKQFVTREQKIESKPNLQINITDLTAGVQEIALPQFFVSHILFINNTNHILTCSRDITLTPHSIIGQCPKYSVISIPFPSMLNRCFIHRSGGANPGEIAFVYFTDFSPGISGNIGPVTVGIVEIGNRRGSLIDHSGSIITANVSQQILPVNNLRNFLMFQNLSTADMFINFGMPANTGSGSYRITQNGSMTFDFYTPTDSVNVVCASVGALYTIKEG